MRAAVKEKHAGARSQAKAKATAPGCATFAIVWRCETSGVGLRLHCENRRALGLGVRSGDTCARRVSFMPRSRAPRILLCTRGLVRGRECPLPLASLARSVAYSEALIKSQMLCAEARSKKQPVAHLGAMQAFVRVKTLGTRGKQRHHLRAVAMTSAAQGAFSVTRVGILGATSRSVRKSQLEHIAALHVVACARQ